MANKLAAVQAAEAKIVKAGFPWLKFELEAHLWRNQSSWDEIRCQTFLDNFVGDLKSKTVYRRFYLDGSVDSELTLTLPTTDGHLITKWMEGFTALSKQITGKLGTENAGLHIAVLKDSAYPCRTHHDPQKLENFNTEVRKLLPGLLFVSSHTYKTRPMRYRRPNVGASKYNAINSMNGSIEYRIFDTCYDKPEAVYEKIEVIAKTLEFYSKRKNAVRISQPLRFEPAGGIFQRIFADMPMMQALDKTLKYVKPKGKTVEQLKKERNLETDPDKLRRKELKEYATVEQKLNRALELWEKRARVELRQFRVEIKDKKGWQSVASDDQKALDYLLEFEFIPRKPTKQNVEQREHARPQSEYTLMPDSRVRPANLTNRYGVLRVDYAPPTVSLRRD